VDNSCYFKIRILFIESIRTDFFTFNVVSLRLDPGSNAIVKTVENWSLESISKPRFPVLTLWPVQPWNWVNCSMKDISVSPIIAEHVDESS